MRTVLALAVSVAVFAPIAPADAQARYKSEEGGVTPRVNSIDEVQWDDSDRGQNSSYKVTYVVDGTAIAASLAYLNDQGGMQQEKIENPWRASFWMLQGTPVYLRAQNQGSQGAITVRILIDGIEYQRSEASGADAIATVGGRCCVPAR